MDVSQVPALFEPWLTCRTRRPGQSQLPHPPWGGRVGAALRQLYGGAVVAQELPVTWRMLWDSCGIDGINRGQQWLVMGNSGQQCLINA